MSSTLEAQRVTVFRREHFNAAHRLFRPDWSTEKNLEVFGKCSYENFHGHNYDLEVAVTGSIDVITGMVVDLKDLSKIIKTEVLDPFDHKNLNADIDDFKSLIPTAENISIVIYNRIKAKLDPEHSLRIRLYETPRNYVEYPTTL